MKKLPLIFLFVLVTASVAATEPPSRDSLEARARTFTRAFFDGRFDIAQPMLDDRMRAALTPDKLTEVRNSVLGQFGAFTGMLGVRFEKLNVYDIVFVTCQFAQDRLDTKVVFDTAMQVSGLFFSPPPPTEEYQLPVYVRASSFNEKKVILNAGTSIPLEGTLSLPDGDAACPCVILVHGSGPNDRDETVGVLKPFKDIAGGLASRGIGVLRYEKRTRSHPQDAANNLNFTVKEEVIDDVVEAVKVLQGEARCRKDKIFVLGHSLGAMVMPRIAARAPEAAGFIFLSPPSRPLEDLMLTQTEYILMLDGKFSEADSVSLTAVASGAARVKRLKPGGPSPAADSLLGVPKAYWLDLRGYEPAEVATAISKPMLVLQGERDYQVTMIDFGSWQSALKGKSNVTFKSYPRLNHLYMEGEGKSSPAEYYRPGNVAGEVIDDLTRWIIGK